MVDGRPPPRCGNFFVAIHDGAECSDSDNILQVWCEFSVTLTMRLVVPFDRAGDQQLSRNLARELARKQGFHAKADQLRSLLHMNWTIAVLASQTPPSANDNIAAWSTTANGQVYGFCEPMHYQNMETPQLVYDDWFQTGTTAHANQFATPDANVPQGIKTKLQFGKARRFQPQTAANGPFI